MAETINSFGKTGIARTKNGQVKFDDFIATLESYQSDAIDYLNEVEPQSQNLFWAGNFGEAFDGEKSEKQLFNAAFRIRKITIPMPKMDIEQQLETKAPIFKNANYTQTVQIEWFEDVYHSIQKYHLDWFSRWYNRKFDVLRCGIAGKFRQLVVTAFHYVNSEKIQIIEMPKIQPIMAFRIGGMIPLGLPDMTFDHGGDMNDQPVAIEYRCGVIEWLYSDRIGIGEKSEKDSIWGATTSVPASLSDLEIWNPIGIVQDTDPEGDAATLEKLRILRSTTSYQISEGSI
jgi:hypothetical protein